LLFPENKIFNLFLFNIKRMPMALPYQELYYASTQQSILTGADGFGVRTFSEGLPKEIVERLKVRDVFVYDSGSKALAGIFDLIHKPDIVLEYPKTFRFFKEEVQGQVYYIFARTVFIGRDYGWYLPEKEESARSGNLFCHAIFWKENDFNLTRPERIFHALQGQFRPWNYSNVPENEELGSLLTNKNGEPVLLPTNYCTVCDAPSPLQWFEHLDQTVLAVYTALENQRKVVVLQQEQNTPKHLHALLAGLPRFVAKSVSMATNFHDFNLYTDNTVLFVNELYPREIPQSHPQLLICDYVNEKFPELPSSDFLNYAGNLIRKGDFEGLSKFNDGLDQMVDAISAGTSFNLLFYAWLHLLTNEPHTYNFNASDVVRNIKDYSLTPDFRRLLEGYVLQRFKESLDIDQHPKVAASLQLLADLHLAPTRLDAAREDFTTYFVRGDNASLLFEHLPDKDLVFNMLALEQRATDAYSFVAVSSLDSHLMRYFLRRFCEAFTLDEVEGVLFMAANSNRIGPEFEEELQSAWGWGRYKKFLEEHDFFLSLGEVFQRGCFAAGTVQYLEEMEKNGHDALGWIRNMMEKAEFFHFYFDKLLDTHRLSQSSYTQKINFLNFYLYLVIEGIRQFTPVTPFDTLFNMVLSGFNWRSHESEIKGLPDKIGRALSAERSSLKTKNSDDTYLRRLAYVEELADFIRDVVNYRNDFVRFTTISIPATHRNDAYKNLVVFMLASVSFDLWRRYESAKELFRFFYSQERIRNEKFLIAGEMKGPIEFIPMYYQAHISKISPPDKEEEFLVEFHNAYIQTLWSLRRINKGEAQDPIKIPSHDVKAYSVSILNKLKAVNVGACRKVLEYIFEQMPDKDTDLLEHLEKNVSTGVQVKKIFKSITSFFKKN